MAQVTITIPDAQLQRVLDAWASEFGYIATFPGGAPNPETKAQFFKRMLLADIKRITVKNDPPQDLPLS